jgi:hypothetical protein
MEKWLKLPRLSGLGEPLGNVRNSPRDRRLHLTTTFRTGVPTVFRRCTMNHNNQIQSALEDLYS